ncbi:carbohydrate ABC transporter permease [Meiothermus taiwanensis]|jgi:multiple sugar transport system permease protein|uniref:Lactose transport system permease protein LacG n=2 Tax=Meiothermus taiwanensis TaxID=172827 RepID=A0A399DZU4_9DEIN|nr:carbohydrate ABC transporter permease [Meiothermus taiwanensis]AWR87788.1 binding-protein-dependent transport systems inner membrane component [Meiothermus taiwanensis WR-220]KIQ53737.1 sugar ABC transporter permease [Meiothermus taiwanensis]KZK16266.1 sugar ABC transporter permease [Meiothermus taiwanensis]RIH77795.1 Lactose transport system permease protein LacG [Meiothermus taiwanensis]
MARVSLGGWLLRIGGYTLLVLGGLLTIAPFYFMFVFATHQRSEIFGFPPPLWFGEHFLTNYQILLEKIPFWRAYWNNFYLALMTTVTSLFFCSLAGFGFAMYQFRWREQLFAVVMATLLVPAILNLIPFYLLIYQIGWINTPKALWVPAMAGALGIFLMRQYIISAIPRELVDAARIDGCSEFQIYWRIVLPLIRPALGTLGLITFIGSWNRFADVNVIMRTQETKTLPVVLRTLQGATDVEWGAIMAGTALLVAPLLLVFALAARQLMEGLTSGAVKN